MGVKHWPADLRFGADNPTHGDLEWLVVDKTAVKVYGIMLREFGPCVDASIYGELVTKVSYTVDGPEFEWTRLLEEEHRRLGYVVEKQ